MDALEDTSRSVLSINLWSQNLIGQLDRTCGSPSEIASRRTASRAVVEMERFHDGTAPTGRIHCVKQVNRMMMEYFALGDFEVDCAFLICPHSVRADTSAR